MTVSQRLAMAVLLLLLLLATGFSQGGVPLELMS